jgi:hypothetical protein
LRAGGAAFIALAAFAGVSDAQSPTAQPARADNAEAPAAAQTCQIPAGTQVVLEFTELVSSKSSKPGDVFNLRLSEPVFVNGVLAVAAGANAEGKVVDAQHPGMGGKPGKIVLAARYLDCGGVRIPLQSLKVGVGTGADYTETSMAVGIAVGVVGLAVQGGNIDYPAGYHAIAKVAAGPPIASANDQAMTGAAQPRQSN